MSNIVCPNCSATVEYHRTHCPRCLHFVGFPNVRRAASMRADLERHCLDARADADRRGVGAQIDRLETLLASAVVTINTGTKVVASMALDHAYRSYYRAYDEGLRRIAEQQYHADRLAVDAKIHTGYERAILNAALSPDGRGLANYGEVTLQLCEAAVRDRASLLRENAFNFYERYDLGPIGAEEAPGWRAVWADRAWLGIAHLAPAVTPAMSVADLVPVIMTPGTNRQDDRFMEVHLYGELTKEAVEKATLMRPLTEQQDRDNWQLARQTLARNGVEVAEAAHS